MGFGKRVGLALLIVATAAGLAVVTCVSIQRASEAPYLPLRVGSAREAQVAAAEIDAEAISAVSIADPRWNTWDKWQQYFTAKCNRLNITYADAGVTATPTYVAGTDGSGTMPDTTSTNHSAACVATQ